MHNILIRAGLSPLDTFSPEKTIVNNSIGDNAGNLIYTYSIYHTLLTENVGEIVPSYYHNRMEDADFINGNYSHYVIPLADAFRQDFVPEMKQMTNLMRHLKIPCTVIGAGIRLPKGKSPRDVFPYDESVKDFICEVLKHSTMIGVRGELTADYLKKLGFQPEKDFTVIGCPSMYLNGPNLATRSPNLSRQSSLAINCNVLTPQKAQIFLENVMKEYPEHYFIAQRINELRLLTLGTPYVHKQNCPGYPTTLEHPLYVNNRVKFFLNAPDWISFLSQRELCIGGRMHGNIAGILGGTPSVFLPHDRRMEELINYHNLPYIPAEKIKPDTDLLDVIASLDFQKLRKGHKERFEHYCSFLSANGLEHIFKNGVLPKVVPLDKKLEAVKQRPEVSSILFCNKDQVAARLRNYDEAYQERFEEFIHYHKRFRNTTICHNIDLGTPVRKVVHFQKKIKHRLSAQKK